MGFSPETYAVARKYTDDTVAGAGAVAGKPCQIQSITDITGGHRVTFLWVDNSSVSHTSTMDVMDGEKGDDGLGIKSVAVNSSNHLIVTYDDDTTEDAGEITLDTSDFVQKSSTAGLLKNDGTVDTTDYTVVSYTQTYSQSGQKIGEITIDGTTTDVVVPTGGGSEHGIPSGGTSGQILSKKSSTDYDVQWTDAGTASQEQADWNEADSSKVDYIKNKPNNLVQDANYVHTDYNYDATAKGIVDGIPLTIQQLQGSLLNKVDKEVGKGLSTNDYDATAKGIVDSIPLTVSQLQGSLLEKFPRSEQAVLGAKNLLKNNATNQTLNNVAFTVNPDGSVYVTNTANATTFFRLNGHVNLKAGDYILSQGVKTNDDDNRLQILKVATGSPLIALIGGSGTEIGFTLSEDTECEVVLRIGNGKNPNGIVFKPMLRLASDPDDTYQPYAMTNRELTEKIDIVGNLFTTTTKVVDNITHGIATTVATLENLPIGTYVVSGQFNSDSAMSGGGLVQFASSGVIQNGASCSTIINQGFKANAGLTGIFNVTNATNQINLQIYTANADLTVASARLAAIRIA